MQENITVLVGRKEGLERLPSKLPKAYFQTSSQF